VVVVDIYYLLERKRIKIILSSYIIILMFLIEDVWGIIKSYMYHNIKIHGKHLKNDPYIIQYNQVMKNIPKPCVPFNGPRIMYSSMTKSTRFIKFVYHLNYFYLMGDPGDPFKKRTLIEIQMLNNSYDAEYLTYDSKFREIYFNQYN
jgi:hypothetical protein